MNESNALKGPTISACMIVKNEEKVLGDCLRSIRDHVDEIIVVDTGSTDGTTAIAESFGARVYRHPWEDHFSRHRNQSLYYAGGEWLFIIDADEELQAEGTDALRTLLPANGDIDAVSLVVECPYGEMGATASHNSIRLFRNHKGIFYKGRVHNYLVGVRGVLCTPTRILHHGYVLDRETQLRRFHRTSTLLKKDIEEDPANPRPHHFLSASYLSENMNEDAAREAEEAIRLYGEGHSETPNRLWSLYIAASAYLEMGDLEKARVWAGKGLETHPDHLDSHYLLAVISYRSGRYEEFHTHLKRYMAARRLIERNPVQFGEMVHNTYTSGWLLYLFQAALCIGQGRQEEARSWLENARSLAPDPVIYHATLGKLLVQSGRHAEASEEFRKSLELRPLDKDLLWLLSYTYERQGKTLEQIASIEKLMDLDPRFPNGAFQAGLAHMRLGRYERARDLFRKAREQDADNRLSRINEALCLRGMGEFDKSLRLGRGAKPGSIEEHRTLLLNEACCLGALGQDEQAVASFLELAEKAPESPDPPVYLSRLFLRKGEIESCVDQCDHLLRHLGINTAVTLHSLSDLGALYLEAAERLKGPPQRHDLAQICREIGLLLSPSPNADPSSSKAR